GENVDTSQVTEISNLISNKFNISLWLFTLPLIVFVLVKKKVPALPALVVGVLLGIVYAVIFQADYLRTLVEGDLSFVKLYKLVLKTCYAGHVSETGHKVIDKLFTRGGMSGMLNTVWLILTAM